MRRTRLTLENFRCFDNAEFDFTAPDSDDPLDLVLLVGGNGSGKTAVLCAICGVLTTLTSRFEGDTRP